MSVVDEYANVGYVTLRVKVEDLQKLTNAVNSMAYNYWSPPGWSRSDVLAVSSAIDNVVCYISNQRSQMHDIAMALNNIMNYNKPEV